MPEAFLPLPVLMLFPYSPGVLPSIVIGKCFILFKDYLKIPFFTKLFQILPLTVISLYLSLVFLNMLPHNFVPLKSIVFFNHQENSMCYR